MREPDTPGSYRSGLEETSDGSAVSVDMQIAQAAREIAELEAQTKRFAGREAEAEQKRLAAEREYHESQVLLARARLQESEAKLSLSQLSRRTRSDKGPSRKLRSSANSSHGSSASAHLGESVSVTPLNAETLRRHTRALPVSPVFPIPKSQSSPRGGPASVAEASTVFMPAPSRPTRAAPSNSSSPAASNRPPVLPVVSGSEPRRNPKDGSPDPWQEARDGVDSRFVHPSLSVDDQVQQVVAHAEHVVVEVVTAAEAAHAASMASAQLRWRMSCECGKNRASPC